MRGDGSVAHGWKNKLEAAVSAVSPADTFGLSRAREPARRLHRAGRPEEP